MRKQTILTAVTALAAACTLLTACSGRTSSSQPVSSSSEAVSSSPEADSNTFQAPEAIGSAPQAAEATLYIGMDGEFTEYPIDYEGELEAGQLIAEMAKLTGWNLALDDEVTSGPGGMTVCFSKDAILFTGPPENQKEEFHLFDVEQMAHTVLDSIQKTLQSNFTAQDGNPNSIDIYYCAGDGQPLTISGLGITLPLDEPYRCDTLSSLVGGTDAADTGTDDPAPADGTVSPFLVEYLMLNLPDAETQLAGAEFYEGEMVEIDGLRCQVVDVIRDGETIALYAIGDGQSALYQFNEETRTFDLLAAS